MVVIVIQQESSQGCRRWWKGNLHRLAMSPQVAPAPSTCGSDSAPENGGGDALKHVLEETQKLIGGMSMSDSVILPGNLVETPQSLRPRWPGQVRTNSGIVKLMAAGGPQAWRITQGETLVRDNETVEFFVPAGRLVKDLGCRIEWGCELVRPSFGEIAVRINQ